LTLLPEAITSIRWRCRYTNFYQLRDTAGAHVRIGELGSPPEIISLLLGAMTWRGLYARDPRIRAILPLIR
jgi:hypothetical protein